MSHGTTQGLKIASFRAPVVLVAVLALVGVFAFAAAPALAASPVFTVDPTPTVGYTTAQVSGTVNPEDNEVFYWFQYSQNPATEGWTSGPEAFTHTLAAGSGSASVSETLTGLKPGTEYQVRLLAFNTNFSGEEWASKAPYVTFTTEPVSAPTVTLDPITTHTDTTAHFSGTVNPNAPAGPPSPAAEAAFKTEWHFQCNPECPGLTPGGIEANAGSQTVSVDATGLEPNTTYEVTLEASNAGGPSTAGPEAFQTTLIPATVKTAPGGSDGKGGYILAGVVNPHNSEVTACHFEYGPSTSYGQSIPCKGTPGAGNKFVEVTAHPTGLTPGATYHYQLVATNGAGPESSGDGTFVPKIASTEACPNEALRAENNSTRLPECRAYEMVTPLYKEGFTAEQQAFRDDGDAFAYISNGSFAGNAAGKAFSQYLATRSAAGWTTTAIDPSEATYAVFAGAGAEVFSPDLGSSLWQLARQDEPATHQPEGPDYLYLRGPDGTFTRIGNTVTAPGLFAPDVVGVSTDLSHVFFSHETGNSANAALYEFVGTGNEGPPLSVSVDNTGASFPGEPCPKGTSSDGRVFVFGCTSNGESALWARVGESTTIAVAGSHCTRTASDPGGACNTNTAIPDLFAGMAIDGSRVYFTTARQLVNGDTDQTNDLYECEIPPGAPTPVGTSNPCASLTEVTGNVTGADVENVVNVSEDGSHVYFVAQGVLASNLGTNDVAPVAGDNNLYVWQKDAAHPAGQTTFVAKLESEAIEGAQSTTDGRYFVFSTPNRLLTSDTDEAYDVYRYDSDTGALLRLSTDTNGSGGNEPGGQAFLSGTPHPHRSIADDAGTVVFETTEALSPADTNGTTDVYEWHEGQVSLISNGGGSRPSITGSGQDIFFQTSQPLAPGDSGAETDVYDARIGGGFPVSAPAPCSGEACQGAQALQPQPPGASASATFNGPGSPLTPETPPANQPKPKPQTAAQKLAKALKACRTKHNRKKRSACEKRARNTYRRAK